MWKKPIFPSCLVAALLVWTASLAFAAGTLELKGTTRWSGEVQVKQQVLVTQGAVLQIAPGTIVRIAAADLKISVMGEIQVAGTAQQPVVFAAPKGWQGIEMAEPSGPSSFDYAEFKGAEAAISSLAARFTVRHCKFVDGEWGVRLLRESFPVIEDSLFEGNALGVDNEMKSGATLRRNLFRGQTKSAVLASHNSKGLIEKNRFEKNAQGITLLQRYEDRIVGNTLVDNQIGIYCNQTQNTPTITGNTFEGNETALVNFSFSYPAVENNTFTNNKSAVHNDQFGSPLLRRNLLRGNGTAIFNNRKSNPVVEENLIEGNQRAIFCDYSSYPQVRRNNFQGNPLGVELGIYQSADWEKRSGSKRIVQKEAAARKSQNPLLAQAPTEFKDVVDVSGNWWGKDTPSLVAAGAEGNLPLFFDRHDKAKVVYEGFGPDSYVLDTVRFAPWLESPVAGAGPGKQP